ncbi:MAG TPA: helix-turn-helix domain-containing protein [Candidatus Thermoplasmatota archaeon]|nr:helix-turn-helix domain-containing protein [Candidatus Thermoplasmatota archaeon]
MARAESREVIYRLTAPAASNPRQLSLRLSRAAPGATIETTVTHLDDEGDVWRTLAVQARPEEIVAVRAAFDAYEAPFLVEKAVLGATPRRLILWYKYRPELVPGVSHTRLAFRLLGRDTVLTDRTRDGVLTIRLLARGGRPLQDFLREARRDAGVRFELLYLGPPRDAGYARLTPAEEETLRAAHDLGYYRVPRGPGVREVAKRLGMSASATGYRLRRAEGKLVSAYLE